MSSYSQPLKALKKCIISKLIEEKWMIKIIQKKGKEKNRRVKTSPNTK